MISTPWHEYLNFNVFAAFFSDGINLKCVLSLSYLRELVNLVTGLLCSSTWFLLVVCWDPIVVSAA